MERYEEGRLKASLGLLAIMFLPKAKQELDDARVLLFFKQLEAYPIEDVETACFNLQGKLRKFPYPADILQEIEEIRAKRNESRIGAPNPRPPGAEPWCGDCDDTGWVTGQKPLGELRPEVDPRDPLRNVMYGYARKCVCWSSNPVRRWRSAEATAGAIRRERTGPTDYNPHRKGNLVPFRKETH